MKPDHPGTGAPPGAERLSKADESAGLGGPHGGSGNATPASANQRNSALQATVSEAAARRDSNARAGGSSGDLADPIYGALDLGTNNCRLLLARPSRRGFRVVDAFSRIIRLGEGVSLSGRLSDQAMSRTMEALKVCAGKLQRHRVGRARMVATQACRVAENGQSFVANVRDNFGLEIEVLTSEMEARLAVAGCATLIDPEAEFVLVFDIGGGSSEIIWLDMTRFGSRRDVLTGRYDIDDAIVAWAHA